MGMKCTKILAALLIGLLAAIIWLGVKSNHNDEQINNVIETPSIEENQANISKFQADNFDIAIDTAIWTEHHYDSGFYSWQNHSDAENFFEVGHVEEKPGIDKLVEFALKKNNCSTYTELILPEDSQYTYAVSMEKENGYLLELYFTAPMDDGTYFLVTCCYNPIDTASRYATQTAVFSMETQ